MTNTEQDKGGNPEKAEAKDTGMFSEGEKVLAYHGPKIYEAKIQKAELRKKEWRYFIHYQGWSKSWDEWIGGDRLMKITEANIEKQKNTIKEAKKNAKAGGKGEGGPEKEDFKSVHMYKKEVLQAGSKGKKRRHEALEEKDEDQEAAVKILIPPVLKKLLIEDMECITKESMLIALPKDITVAHIVAKYLESRAGRSASSVENNMVSEMLLGLQGYFEKALPAILLYKEEREQYTSYMAQHPTAVPSATYGAEHLLRLFVKLPELLPYANMEPEALSILQQKLGDFTKYLQRNHSTLFNGPYRKVEGAADNTEGGRP